MGPRARGAAHAAAAGALSHPAGAAVRDHAVHLRDAAIQAEILKAFQAPAPQPVGPEGQGVQSVADTSGGGGSQIGMGTAPLPEEQGFTGNAPQAVGQ